MANIMRRDISNETILENYDFEKSVEENSLLLKEKEMEPRVSTSNFHTVQDPVKKCRFYQEPGN